MTSSSVDRTRPFCRTGRTRMMSSKFEHFFVSKKNTKKDFRKRFYPKVRSPKRKRGGSKSFPIRRKSLTRQRLEVELLQLHRRRHQRRIHAPTHTLQSSQEEEEEENLWSAPNVSNRRLRFRFWVFGPESSSNVRRRFFVTSFGSHCCVLRSGHSRLVRL